MSASRNRTGQLHLFVTLAAAGLTLNAVTSVPVHAQNSSGVTVNMDVLNDLDPMATVPRLLMPRSAPQQGRIVLTPPAGVQAITPQQSRIVLRPPPSAPARVSRAPEMTVAPPAAAAAAPPTAVTAAPARPEPQEPPPPTPAPVAEVVEAPMPAPETVEQTPQPEGPAAAPTAEAATSQPREQEVASLPDPEPASSTADDDPVTISFGMEETVLPDSATAPLQSLADRLNGDDSLRVQLMAYASSADGSPSSVRRKSLSRALSVREFLMDQGVQSTRIEVRALGDQSEGGEPDRVDAIVEQR